MSQEHWLIRGEEKRRGGDGVKMRLGKEEEEEQTGGGGGEGKNLHTRTHGWNQK